MTIRLWDPATGALQHTVEGNGFIYRIKFGHDGSCLITNLGSFNIQSTHDSHTSKSLQVDSGILIEQGQWIVLKSEKLLWLPLEFRPCCLAIDSNLLALGLPSGRVTFIRFLL
jgi:hypothetical protein